MDHAIFFAREQEVDRLTSLVSVYRGTMLYGTTGTGKSSLINAGLLPRAVELGYRPERVRVQPRAGEALVVERIVTADDDSEALPSVLAGPQDAAARVVLSTADFEQRLHDACAEHRPLLVFDQFEELCTLFETEAAAEVRLRIVDLLVRLLRSPLPVKLLFVFREDYLGKIKQLLAACPELVDQALLLTPLAPETLPTIIRGPFERYPGHFARELDPPLVERLRGALAERFGAEDLSLSEVQTVCLRLWQADDPDRLLAEKGVQGLLEDYLGEALDAFPPQTRFAAVALLGQMVTAAGTRNVISADDIVQRVREEDPALSRPLLEDALDRLDRESRLVRRERRRDLDLYEITSEFLVPWISRRRTEASRQRERARDRRRLLALGGLVGALALVVVFVAAVALWAWRQQVRADRAANTAAAVASAAGSVALVGERPDISLLLALSAYDADPGLQERNALVTALEMTGMTSSTGLLHGHTDAVRTVAFAPGGGIVASAGNDTTIRLWSARSHRQLGAPLQGHGEVIDVAFAPDGRTLASAGNDGAIRLWSVRTHAQLGHALRAGSGFSSVVFSPDGRTLASGDWDGVIRLWSVSTHRQLGRFAADPGGAVYDVAFSPDGRMLASAGDDGRIRMWSVGARRAVPGPAFARLASPVYDVAFSPSGRTLASAGRDFRIRLWSVRTHRQTGALDGHTALVYRVAFGPGGRTLASAGYDGTVRVWDVAARKQLGEPFNLGDTVEDVAWSPDGRTLVAANWKGVIRLWNPRDPHRFGAALRGTTRGLVSRVAFSPDGRTLASSSWDDTVRLWDVAGRHPLGRPLAGHRSEVEDVAFSPDGRLLASGGDDRTVRLWRVATHRQVAVLRGHARAVGAVAFSPDGRLLASGGKDRTVRLWRVATGRQIAVLHGNRGVVGTVAFSPDGRLLASGGGDRTVRLWSVATHRQVAVLRGHLGAVSAVAFSPAGGRLASSSWDFTIRVWNVATHRTIRVLSERKTRINDIAFDRSGDVLASVGVGQVVRLWNVRYGTALGMPLTGHQRSVTAVAFSPDGTTLASGDAGGSIRVWGGVLWNSFAALRAVVCHVAGAGLSHAEWRRSMPRVPYHQACPSQP